MNVEDIKDDVIPTPTPGAGDRLALVFGRQLSLMHKYHPIEERNGLLLHAGIPVPIDDRFGQARLKDFAWRLTEELTEATAALDDDGLKVHFIEELSDAFHFLIELLLLAGFTADTLTDEVEVHLPMSKFAVLDSCKFTDCRLTYHANIASAWAMLGDEVPDDDTAEGGRFLIDHLTYATVETLGRAMNCLKQKPWKQTHMLTDQARLRKHLAEAYLSFLALCKVGAHLAGDDLFQIYWKKSEVNKFRQRSAY